MNKYEFTLQKNQSLNRCLYTDIKKEAFDSSKTTFDEPVNLTEEYVQIIYPVRAEFMEKHRNKNIDLYEGDFSNTYFPFENNKVEFSSFIKTPHTLKMYTKTFIEVETSCKALFDLYTCGGIVIWVNGKEVIRFQPYTRNIGSKKEIELPLEAGINEIVVYADELAERDVFYYYELRYKGDKELKGFIPIDEDVEKIKKCEDFMKSCYFDKDEYYSGDVCIHFDKNKVFEGIDIEILQGFRLFYEQNITRYSLEIDENDFALLGNINDLPIGAHGLFLVGKVGSIEIPYKLVVCLYPKEINEIEIPKTLVERKATTLKFLAEKGTVNINKAIAIFEVEKKLTDEAIKCLETGFNIVESMGDCADFYIVPMMLIYKRYNYLLTPEIKKRMEDAFLNFRYWLDEPGNDVMWWFSENHALLFHIAQYIAGDIFNNEIFAVSKRTGLEQKQIGKERLIEWFETFFKYGFGEWNSTTYIPIDLIGFISLYEMATDKEIKDLAKKALDKTFKIMAFNLHGNMFAASYGRVYENDLKALEFGELTLISWMAWGKGYMNTSTRSTSLLAVSSYEPTPIENIVRLNDHNAIQTEYRQGVNHVLAYNYLCKYYAMGSAINYKAYVHGHQQHVFNISMQDDNTQLWINHPGEHPFSGENRPSYWAGNGTKPHIEQYKNISFLSYDIEKEELVKFIHLYFPSWKFDKVEHKNNWLFIRKKDSYLGVYFDKGYEVTKSGALTNKEVRAYGERHIVVAKLGSVKEFGTFERFIEKYERLNIEMVNTRDFKFNDPQFGKFEFIDEKCLNLNDCHVDRTENYDINHIEEELIKVK